MIAFGGVLVPTRVGMILIDVLRKLGMMTCPHTRGDDPHYGKFNYKIQGLSPHAWG